MGNFFLKVLRGPLGELQYHRCLGRQSQNEIKLKMLCIHSSLLIRIPTSWALFNLALYFCSLVTGNNFELTRKWLFIKKKDSGKLVLRYCYNWLLTEIGTIKINFNWYLFYGYVNHFQWPLEANKIQNLLERVKKQLLLSTITNSMEIPCVFLS